MYSLCNGREGDWTVSQVDESSNGKEIELTVGETLEVRLAENRTAGFKWTLESRGEGPCSFVSDDFEPGHLTGEPGNHRWHFRAERAGSGTITLSYRRSWEEKGT